MYTVCLNGTCNKIYTHAILCHTSPIDKKRKHNTLKKVISVSIALFFFAHLQAQPTRSKEQQEIQQTVVNMFQALSDRDSIALTYYCTPDVSLYEYGQVWNMDTLIRKAITMNQSADFKRTNTFEFIRTEYHRSAAWVTYRLHSVVIKDGIKTDIQWLETLVLARQKKQWKVRHLHSTLIKKS